MVTADGVFSADRVDLGTRVLLREVPRATGRRQPAGPGLRLGTDRDRAHLRAPAATVLGDRRQRPGPRTDRGERRASWTCRGSARCSPDDVPDDVRFAAIWSNPPIRVGKDGVAPVAAALAAPAASRARTPTWWCSATWVPTRCTPGLQAGPRRSLATVSTVGQREGLPGPGRHRRGGGSRLGQGVEDAGRPQDRWAGEFRRRARERHRLRDRVTRRRPPGTSTFQTAGAPAPPQTRAAIDGGDDTGAAGPGLPHPPLEHPHRHVTPVPTAPTIFDVDTVRGTARGRTPALGCRSSSARSPSRTGTLRWGLPTSTTVCPGSRRHPTARALDCPPPIRTVPMVIPTSPVRPSSAVHRSPARVLKSKRLGLLGQPAETRYLAKTRMPLPHISRDRAVGVAVVHEPLGVPRCPAAVRACAAVRTTRSTPSRADPACRSQSAASSPRSAPAALPIREQDEVVLGAVPLGEAHPPMLGGDPPFPAGCGALPPPSAGLPRPRSPQAHGRSATGSAASSHLIRGPAGTRIPGGGRTGGSPATVSSSACSCVHSPPGSAASARSRGARLAVSPRAARGVQQAATSSTSPPRHICSTRAAIRSSRTSRGTPRPIWTERHASSPPGASRERAPGHLDHLEGAHDPAAVAGQDRGGGRRIGRGEPAVQRGGPRAASSASSLARSAGSVRGTAGRRWPPGRTGPTRRPGSASGRGRRRRRSLAGGPLVPDHARGLASRPRRRAGDAARPRARPR